MTIRFSNACAKTTWRQLDDVTKGHSIRVSLLATEFATALNDPLISVDAVKMAAFWHDIGKLAIPRSILLHPGPLSETDFVLVKTHPEKGLQFAACWAFDPIVSQAVYMHHEKFNGLGYPKALSGTDIPRHVRLLTIIDSYDAMTGSRSYRTSLSIHEALNEIVDLAGVQFDPVLAEQFANWKDGRIKQAQ